MKAKSVYVLSLCILLSAISKVIAQTSILPNDSISIAAGNAIITQSPLLTDVQQTIDSLKQSNSKAVRKSKLYYRLAVAFAKMKMYPQALKCFYQSTRELRKKGIDTSVLEQDKFYASLMQAHENILQTKSGEAIAVLGDTVLVNKINFKKAASKPIKDSDILKPFNDNKTASTYGVIVHVKQPVRGKRKKIRLFHGDVGHTFITLIKYNIDGSYVVRTFGFYPIKSLPLEATPLIPGTAADFKNDALHDWDEAVGTFIDKDQFNLILDITKRYAKKRYHLSKNNCTDFGLNIAGIAGIHVEHTKGKWLLGGGNDPADMGQSIRENEVVAKDGKLFICVEGEASATVKN